MPDTPIPNPVIEAGAHAFQAMLIVAPTPPHRTPSAKSPGKNLRAAHAASPAVIAVVNSVMLGELFAVAPNIGGTFLPMLKPRNPPAPFFISWVEVCPNGFRLPRGR